MLQHVTVPLDDAIGGGPVGCELAQAFRRLGAEVDPVSDTETLLPRDEPEAGQLIQSRLEREGVRLYLGFKAVPAVDGRLTVQGPAKEVVCCSIEEIE